MLVLARRVGERILIGDQIAVTVVKAGPNGVRLGVEAPAEMAVVREELAQQIADQQAEKAEVDPPAKAPAVSTKAPDAT